MLCSTKMSHKRAEKVEEKKLFFFGETPLALFIETFSCLDLVINKWFGFLLLHNWVMQLCLLTFWYWEAIKHKNVWHIVRKKTCFHIVQYESKQIKWMRKPTLIVIDMFYTFQWFSSLSCETIIDVKNLYKVYFFILKIVITYWKEYRLWFLQHLLTNQLFFKCNF